jgi:hypothetical protein
VEVIDRLARIETQDERILERLDWINGTVTSHGTRLIDHDQKLARMRGATSVIAALVAAAMSAFFANMRAWFGR